MNDLVLLSLARDALFLTLKVAAIPLGVSLLVGVAIAFVQAIVQIQEMTVTFVPKLIAMFLSLILFGPFMGSSMIEFGRHMFGLLADYGSTGLVGGGG